MTKEKFKSIIVVILKLIPIAAFAGFIIFILTRRDEITVDYILSYMPDNAVIAVASIIVLYAIKSVSIFLPLIVIKIAVGAMYPPLIAILINSIGICVSFIIPYFIGRKSKGEFTQKLVEKHPKVAKILYPNEDKQFFICFLLRSIYFLPSDIVSMFLGARKIPMHKYILGGLFGMMPSIITTTLMGSSIKNISSPMFWVCGILTLMFSALAYLLYFVYTKKKSKGKQKS